MKPRVVLLSAPAIMNQFITGDNSFPLGLMYLGTILKARGADVSIIDVKTYCENELPAFYEDLNEKPFRDYLQGPLRKGTLPCIYCEEEKRDRDPRQLPTTLEGTNSEALPQTEHAPIHPTPVIPKVF